MSKYDESGVLKTILTPNLKSGDSVRYNDVRREGRKLIKIWIHGIWDGEKVEFYNTNQTIVRNKRWLIKL